MKTIGILTYQGALNYGAAFQCKALYQYVKNKQQSNQVVVISYLNDNIYKKTSLKSQLTSRDSSFRKKAVMIANSIFSKLQRNKFKSFYSDVSFSKEYSASNICDVTKECDYFIIGSDQLWNFELNGGDRNYLMPFAEKNRVITYSTSIGKEKIPDEVLEDFINNVYAIPFVSVREEKAREYINKLIPNKEIALTMDPVFLMDRKWWISISGVSTHKESVGMYFFHKEFLPNAYKIIADEGLSDKKIYKICGGLSIRDFLNPSVRTGLLYGPDDVLRTMNKCKLMFTDSFHCVAISIILHVDFYVYLTGDEGRDSRILQLLNIAGLTDRVVSSGKLKKNEIAWEDVDKRIFFMQQYSKEYLDRALDIVLR